LNKLDKAIVNWWMFRSHHVRKPTRFIRVVLLFLPWKEYIAPDQRIWRYKSLRGQVYKLHKSAWWNVTHKEYNRLFGINRRT
jgi:hypothetical protein